MFYKIKDKTKTASFDSSYEKIHQCSKKIKIYCIQCIWMYAKYVYKQQNGE